MFNNNIYHNINVRFFHFDLTYFSTKFGKACCFDHNDFNLNAQMSLLKDALSGLTQFLPTESLLKMMKITFYFTLKALFILTIFNFLS